MFTSVGFALPTTGSACGPGPRGFGLQVMAVPLPDGNAMMGGGVAVGGTPFGLRSVQLRPVPCSDAGAGAAPAGARPGPVVELTAEVMAAGAPGTGASEASAGAVQVGALKLHLAPLDGQMTATGQVVLGGVTFGVLSSIVPSGPGGQDATQPSPGADERPRCEAGR